MKFAPEFSVCSSLQRGDLALQLPLPLRALPPPLQTSCTPNALTFLLSFISQCLRKPSPYESEAYSSLLVTHLQQRLPPLGSLPDSLGRESLPCFSLCFCSFVQCDFSRNVKINIMLCCNDMFIQAYPPLGCSFSRIKIMHYHQKWNGYCLCARKQWLFLF